VADARESSTKLRHGLSIKVAGRTPAALRLATLALCGERPWIVGKFDEARRPVADVFDDRGAPKRTREDTTKLHSAVPQLQRAARGGGGGGGGAGLRQRSVAARLLQVWLPLQRPPREQAEGNCKGDAGQQRSGGRRREQRAAGSKARKGRRRVLRRRVELARLSLR
jgi:hypothetical protein